MEKNHIASVDACKLNKDILRKIPNPATIVIFGASGDLTERKLIPSLFRLDCDGLLPEKLGVVCVAGTKMDSEVFRKKLAERFEFHSRHSKDQICKWSEFEKKLIYHRADYDNLEDYKALNRFLVDLDKKQGIGANCLFYLSTPPILYPVIVSKLGEAGMAQQSDEYWRRIIIEKPVGRDLASAIDL